MAPPSTDPTLVAEALAKVAELAETLGLGPAREEAARLTGVSVATIRRAQAAARASGPPKASRGARPAKRPAKAKPVAPPAAPAAPPPAIPLLPDLLDELRGFLALTKGQLEAAAGKHGYASIGQLADKLAARIAAIEAQRTKPGAELSHVLGKGPVAVAKIRQGCAAVARREAESGKCARCGAPLAPEVMLNRRTEAGLDAASVH